jgi:hypothetical protein
MLCHVVLVTSQKMAFFIVTAVKTSDLKVMKFQMLGMQGLWPGLAARNAYRSFVRKPLQHCLLGRPRRRCNINSEIKNVGDRM